MISEGIAKLRTYLSVNSKLCGELVPLVLKSFFHNQRVTSIAFFVAGFN